MLSQQIRQHVMNWVVLVVFVLELGIWGIWSLLFMRAPFRSPLIRPVMDFSTEVGQFVFGCSSLACIPYTFAGVVIYFYAIAVVITNLYDWAKNWLPVEPA